MRTRSILRSKEFATFKKMLTILFIISPVMLLTSCSDEPTAKTVAACMTKDASEYGRCAENALKVIPDEWVRNCVVGNISEKDDVSKRLVASTVTKEDLKDIDGVVKECMYYQDLKGTSTTKNDGYPVFSSFVASAAGSFAGNYIANQLFNNVSDYSKFDYNTRQKSYTSSGSSAGSSARGYFGGTSGSNNGNKATVGTSNGNGSSGNDTIGKIDKQYKESTWNIKQMKDKASLSKGTGYKLGDTGKNWSNVADSFRASKSTSGGGWGSIGKSSGGSSVSKGSSSLG